MVCPKTLCIEEEFNSVVVMPIPLHRRCISLIDEKCNGVVVWRLAKLPNVQGVQRKSGWSASSLCCRRFTNPRCASPHAALFEFTPCTLDAKHRRVLECTNAIAQLYTSTPFGLHPIALRSPHTFAPQVHIAHLIHRREPQV